MLDRMRSLLLILAILPLATAGASGGNSAPVERQVSFKSADGVLLAGTLLLPQMSGAGGPGVLLIQGSGPTDRNGNQGRGLRSDVLRQLADELAVRGIA